jgi:hypothetical protein
MAKSSDFAESTSSFFSFLWTEHYSDPIITKTINIIKMIVMIMYWLFGLRRC